MILQIANPMSYFSKMIIEYIFHRNYNNYRSMVTNNSFIKDQLSIACGIHKAMQYGAISYSEAKLRVQPILGLVNDHIRLIAKQHKVKPRYIKFQDLGREI